MRLGLFLMLASMITDAIAQSAVDYELSTSEAIWAFTECVAAFGLGFIAGTKIKLTRKIVEML